MRFFKYLLIYSLFLVTSGFLWFYYPYYQINKVKNDFITVGKDLGKETYLDYYRQSKKNDIYHLALGDSIIHGFGVGETDNLVYNFSNQLGEEINKTVQFKNMGKNGLTSTQLNRQIQEGKYAKEISKADIITINIGGNDILKTAKKKNDYEAVKLFDQLQATFTKNLSEISKEISKINPEATVVFLELYNPLSADHQLAELAESLLPKWNVNIYQVAKEIPSSLVIETTKVINNKNPQNLSKDGVHPNSAGYAAITKQMLEQFSKEHRREAI